MITFKKFYVTTAIDYPNADPHLGHAYEKLLADFLSRYHRQKGENVFYQTGTDEHGSKIFQTAENEGISPLELVDRNSGRFKEFYKLLNIQYDNFIRTSDKEVHWAGVEKLWKALDKSGDLYKKSYKAKYCVGCESFKTESELDNGECSNHPGKELTVVEEDNYFFRLSRYTARLIKLIESDEYRIRPVSAKNEILSFLKDDVKDISFSRSRDRLPWGIPVPGDSDQVIYVWADALTNYLTGIGYGRSGFGKWWPADVHLIGKDISRFHAVYWPAMLISANIETPRELWVHGMIKDFRGKKMSKTVGNVIAPASQVKQYGVDSVRYYLLRALPSNQDGNYSEEDLVVRHNSELVNNLGNLLSRSLNLIEKNGGKVPIGNLDSALKSSHRRALEKIEEYVDDFEFHHAVSEIWKFISTVNEYVDEKKPWELSGKALDVVLYNLAESLRLISSLVYPVIPGTAEEIAKQLGLKSVPKFGDSAIEIGTKIKKGEHLFSRI